MLAIIGSLLTGILYPYCGLGDNIVYLQSINVCHEKNSYRDGHFTRELRNFERDGGRPIAYGMQVLFANHFVRLGGKLTGRERQLEG